MINLRHILPAFVAFGAMSLATAAPVSANSCAKLSSEFARAACERSQGAQTGEATDEDVTAVNSNLPCDRQTTAYLRELCFSSEAAVSEEINAPQAQAGTWNVIAGEDRSPYASQSTSVVTTGPTDSVRPQGPVTTHSMSDRTFDGHVVGSQPKPAWTTCASSGEVDANGRSLADGCVATDGILALKPGGSMYLQSFNDAMHVTNNSGAPVPLPTCDAAEYRSIANNRHLTARDACFTAHISYCPGTEGAGTVKLQPAIRGDTVNTGVAGITATCNGDANWSLNYDGGHECQAERIFYDRVMAPVLQGDGSVSIGVISETEVGRQPQILQSEASPSVTITPDTSYVRVDGNYRGPGSFGENSCTVTASFSATYSYTPPGRTRYECWTDMYGVEHCPSDTYCAEEGSILLQAPLMEGVLHNDMEGSNPSGIALCANTSRAAASGVIFGLLSSDDRAMQTGDDFMSLLSNGVFSSPAACPTGGNGIHSYLRDTPTDGLLACMKFGGMDPQDDPLRTIEPMVIHDGR